MKTAGLMRIVGGTLATVTAALVLYPGCSQEDSPLAPYGAGDRSMSLLTVEAGTWIPRLSWLGGYVSVLGVNEGKAARLDSSLVWLIRMSGNTLKYPVTYGTRPSGAQELTATYGGTSLAALDEDTTYTFWTLKEEAWGVVAQNPGKPLAADTALTVPAQVRNDTVFVSSLRFTAQTHRIDVYINVRNIISRGRLGTMNVSVTNRDNNPIFSWIVSQLGVTDTAVAVFGIVEGGSYDLNRRAWEILSVDTVGGLPVYRASNIIPTPLVSGQAVPRTTVFAAYAPGGLQRNTSYYAFMANKNWDGINRFRSTPYYTYLTFETW